MNLSLWNRWVTAIDAGNVAQVAALVREHPEWRWRTAGDGNPLIRVMAAEGLNVTVRRALLDVLLDGLEPGALRSRSEPLWMAADSGWDEALVRLLPLCDPDARHQGSSPLVRAAMWGNTAAVGLLLPASDPNLADDHGLTALMMAAKSDHTESLAVVLAHGAVALDQGDLLGRTALLWAAAENQTKALVLLLDAGANPDVQDHEGRTALMLAAAGAHGIVASRLMLHHRRALEQGRPGLNFQLLDRNGYRAEDLAGEQAPSVSATFRRTLAQHLRQARVDQEQASLREALGTSSVQAPTEMTMPGDRPPSPAAVRSRPRL